LDTIATIEDYIFLVGSFLISALTFTLIFYLEHKLTKHDLAHNLSHDFSDKEPRNG